MAKMWEHIERIGRRARFEPRAVLVTGAGPIGLLAALLGVQRGLQVHVLDRVTEGPKPAWSATSAPPITRARSPPSASLPKHGCSRHQVVMPWSLSGL